MAVRDIKIYRIHISSLRGHILRIPPVRLFAYRCRSTNADKWPIEEGIDPTS